MTDLSSSTPAKNRAANPAARIIDPQKNNCFIRILFATGFHLCKYHKKKSYSRVF